MEKKKLSFGPSIKTTFQKLDEVLEHIPEDQMLSFISTYFVYRKAGLIKGVDVKETLCSDNEYVVQLINFG